MKNYKINKDALQYAHDKIFKKKIVSQYPGGFCYLPGVSFMWWSDIENQDFLEKRASDLEHIIKFFKVGLEEHINVDGHHFCSDNSMVLIDRLIDLEIIYIPVPTGEEIIR